jgi:hypothetical protein
MTTDVKLVLIDLNNISFRLGRTLFNIIDIENEYHTVKKTFDDALSSDLDDQTKRYIRQSYISVLTKLSKAAKYQHKHRIGFKIKKEETNELELLLIVEDDEDSKIRKNWALGENFATIANFMDKTGKDDTVALLLSYIRQSIVFRHALKNSIEFNANSFERVTYMLTKYDSKKDWPSRIDELVEAVPGMITVDKSQKFYQLKLKEIDPEMVMVDREQLTKIAQNYDDYPHILLHCRVLEHLR